MRSPGLTLARLRGFAVDQDIACVGSRLDAVARTTLHVDRQELVQPQRVLPPVGRDAVMFVQLVLLAGSVVLEFVRIGYVLLIRSSDVCVIGKFVFRCLFVREKPVVDDRLRFGGRLARLSRRTRASEIGRFSVEAAQLFGGFYHLLIGRSALGGDFGSIEGQLQIDLRTQPGTAAGRRRLPDKPGLPAGSAG